MVDVTLRLARTARAKALTMFAVGALVLTLVGLYLIEQRSAEWVQRSRQRARDARTTLNLAIDEETGVRGFVLAQDTLLLAPQRAADARLPALLARLVDDGDDLTQQRLARQARDRLVQWHASVVAPVLGDPSSFTAPEARERWVRAGKQRFDGVRASLGTLINREDLLYAERLARDERIRMWGVVLLLAEILAIATAAQLSDRRLLAQATELLENSQRLEEQAVELEITAEEAQILAHEREDAFAVLDAVLASAPAAFAFIDVEGNVVHHNAEFDALRSAHDAHGTAPSPDARATAVTALLAPVAEVRADNRPRIGQAIEVHGAEGASSSARRTWTASYYPVYSGARAIGVGVIASETTQQLRLESELRQAQKMEAIGQLAGSVAHDFNNVLTVITSYGEMLLMDMPPSPERDDVAQMVKASHRAAALTKQLLTFSRKEDVQPRPLELNAVVKGLEDMLRRLIGEDIQVIVRAEGVLPDVVADQSQVEQVIVNLSVNARDAMPGGGILLIETSTTVLAEEDVAIHPGLTRGPYVVLAVSDTGVGMDPELQARVFEPYFTTKAKGQGTGIGLATVYGIVRQAGGHVSLYSEPGQGSTFRIWLPAASAAEQSALQVRDVPAPATTDEESRVVLVADDDELVRDAVVRVLQRKGYTVLTAKDGADALRVCTRLAAANQALDLLITDVIMPEMSGPEMVEQVRASMRETRVLFMSGYTGTHLAGANLPAGVSAFIEKPFTVEALLEKVEHIFRSGPQDLASWTPPRGFPTAGPAGRVAREMARRAVESERRTAVALQRSLEARHRAILDALQQGVMLVDAEGTVLLSNPSADHAMGSSASLAGMHLRDVGMTIVDERGLAIPVERHPALLAFREGGDRAAVFGTTHAPDAPAERWWLGHARMLHTGGGAAAEAAVWAFAEITALKEAEAALERESALSDAILENLREGVIACDAGGAISLANDAARAMIGSAAVGLALREWASRFDLRQPDGARYASDALPLARALRGEVVRNADVLIRRATGDDRHVLSSARPLRVPGRSDILGAVVTLQDVTEYRTREAELRRALDDALAARGNA